MTFDVCAGASMTRRVCLAAVMTLGFACARGPGTSGPVQRSSEPASPSISLSEIETGQWKVVIRALQPTAALRFVRNPDDSRARRWRTEPDFELVHEGGVDLLRRKDRGSFLTASAIVAARYAALPKEYAPFSPYSDGGTLIYSGQFHACATGSDCPSDARFPFRVAPPQGKHLIVEGGLHESEFEFTDAGDGTNIYVGKATPLASSHFVAVIDSGLPQAARAALYRLLPQMMDFYTSRLGRLPFKPMLFASLDPYPPKNSGFSMQGGALERQVFFHLYGEEWTDAATDKLLERLPWLFAHEAGHLYQSLGLSGDAYPKDQSWIHEGGAEAFAALTVVEFGGASCDSVEERIEGAVTECAAGLEALVGRPLNASAEVGAFRNYYTCGLVIHLAIDAEMQRTSRGTRDLFDVWAEFSSRVRAGESVNQGTFLRTASDLGAIHAASFARTLATEPQRDPLQFLRTIQNESGRRCGVDTSPN
jgi:hypothetical protein